MEDGPIKLRDYWTKLNAHDWFFEYSDDHRVWTKGRDSESHIKACAKLSPEHQKLYDDFKAHKWEQLPKPEQPE